MKASVQLILMSVVALVFSATASAQVPVSGVSGAKLQDLVGSPTLVTVVLKSGPEDVNLNVVDIGPDYVSFKMQNGQRTAYKFSALKEIRVQGDAIAAKAFTLDRSRALTPEEQKIYDGVTQKAKAFFDGPQTDQSIRMDAAGILVLSNDQSAEEYLTTFLNGNDTATAVEAAVRLYAAGKTDALQNVLQSGISSGNRNVRAKAVLLLGLTGNTSQEGQLMEMLRDRLADYSAPAMRTLAMLNNEAALPMMYDAILDSNSIKGEAAVFALGLMKSDEIPVRLKELLTRAKNFERFRIARALYAHNDTTGRQLLQGEFLDVPSLRTDTAIILAKQGDRDGIRILNEILDERYNPTTEVLKKRAEMAMALVIGGDGAAITIVQELLGSDDLAVLKYTCDLIADSGVRRLMPLTQSSVENADAKVSMSACQATIACANPDYRDRLVGTRQ